MDTIQTINSMESFPVFREIRFAMGMVFQHRFFGPQRHHGLPEIHILQSISSPKFPFFLKNAEQCDQIFQTWLNSHVAVTESYENDL